jgi:hypothetical protein
VAQVRWRPVWRPRVGTNRGDDCDAPQAAPPDGRSAAAATINGDRLARRSLKHQIEWYLETPPRSSFGGRPAAAACRHGRATALDGVLFAFKPLDRLAMERLSSQSARAWPAGAALLERRYSGHLAQILDDRETNKRQIGERPRDCRRRALEIAIKRSRSFGGGGGLRPCSGRRHSQSAPVQSSAASFASRQISSVSRSCLPASPPARETRFDASLDSARLGPLA